MFCSSVASLPSTKSLIDLSSMIPHEPSTEADLFSALSQIFGSHTLPRKSCFLSPDTGGNNYSQSDYELLLIPILSLSQIDYSEEQGKISCMSWNSSSRFASLVLAVGVLGGKGASRVDLYNFSENTLSDRVC